MDKVSISKSIRDGPHGTFSHNLLFYFSVLDLTLDNNRNRKGLEERMKDNSAGEF